MTLYVVYKSHDMVKYSRGGELKQPIQGSIIYITRHWEATGHAKRWTVKGQCHQSKVKGHGWLLTSVVV